jgi:hypothetical protein
MSEVGLDFATNLKEIRRHQKLRAFQGARLIIRTQNVNISNFALTRVGHAVTLHRWFSE